MNIQVSGPMIQEIALEFLLKLYNKDEFKASDALPDTKEYLEQKIVASFSRTLQTKDNWLFL